MAENHDLLRMPPTAMLVAPLECGDHVHKTIVAGDALSAFRRPTRMREKPMLPR
jgi:hypothetical protein